MSLFTETQKKMITDNGDVFRYIGSNVIDKFDIGDCADISFPNGYGKGTRVCKQCCQTLNTTTTSSSFIVKVPIEWGSIDG